MNTRRIREKFGVLLKARSVRDVLTLASGTSLAQFIPILTAPIVYRLYSKEEYGVLGQFISIAMVLGAFSSLFYSQSILVEKEESGAKKMFWVSRFLNLAISLFVLVLMILLKPWILDVFHAPQIGFWLYFIPLSIFVSEQNLILANWCNRQKDYKLITFQTMIRALVVPAFTITMGLFDMGEAGLITGYLSGQAISWIWLAYSVNKRHEMRVPILKEDILQLLRKYRDFPFYSLPAEFLNRFARELPVFMLSAFTNLGFVGLYNMSARILGLPLKLIAGAIAKVFRQKAAESYNRGENCQPLVKNTLLIIGLISIVPFLLLILFAPDLFAFAFGEKWREAGTYSQILSILYWSGFIVSPISFFYFIAKRQKEDFVIRIPMLILMALSLFIGLQYYTVYIALMLFSLTRAVFYGFIGVRIFQFARNK